jgi:hypothetical protein
MDGSLPLSVGLENHGDHGSQPRLTILLVDGESEWPPHEQIHGPPETGLTALSMTTLMDILDAPEIVRLDKQAHVPSDALLAAQ